MAHTDATLRGHPGLNEHAGQLGESGQFFGRGKNGIWRRFDAGRYVPHYGAKERAKYATAAPHRLGGSA